MQTFDTLFQRELRALVAARIIDLKDGLASNMTPLEEVKFLRGQIAGLLLLDDMMAEAAERADQRNR